jgi:hypothetical protein
MLSTLLEGSAAFSDQSMDWLKSIKNYSSDELYIQLTKATSRIVKYSADPLTATGLYYSLFSLISLVLTSASTNFTATSFAYVFVEANTSIKSISSSRLPVDWVNLSNKFLSKR